MNLIAIIPARGGSKRLPRKNIKHFLGKPLIAWTIEEALKSKYIEKVFVDTDDEEIANISKNYGAEVPFLRKKDFAKDKTTSVESIKIFLERLSKEENINSEKFILLQCTSPLRMVENIDESIGIFSKEKDADSLISVRELGHPITWIKNLQNGYLNSYFEKNELKNDTLYLPNGAIYLLKTEVFLKKESFQTQKTIPYIMDYKHSFDIDNIVDFEIAEMFMKKFFVDIESKKY